MTTYPTHEHRTFIPVADCPVCDGTSWAPRWDPTYGQYVGIPCKTRKGEGVVKVDAAKMMERAA